MTTVLILAAGAAHDDRDSGYPLCLTEIGGKPLIQRLIEQCELLGDVQLVLAVQDSDCKRWHLDNVVRQLSPTAKVLQIHRPTAGAACTALLAIGDINNDEPLLILNGDELIDIDFNTPIKSFVDGDFDGGTVVFRSVHPRYSFVRLNEDGIIVEAAEKNPISQNATAGFYWFRKGNSFVKAAQACIRKNAHVDGSYYICPTMNELVLAQARLTTFSIETTQFHPLKSERQMERMDNQFTWRADA